MTFERVGDAQDGGPVTLFMEDAPTVEGQALGITIIAVRELGSAPRLFASVRVRDDKIVAARLARPEGLEPPTLWSEARCSIR
jgi:hypothetical protein